MNAVQIKYTLTRIETLQKQKQAAIRHRYASKPELTTPEKVRLITTDKVKLNLPEHVDEYTRILQCFDFSKYQPGNTEIRKQCDEQLALLEKEVTVLKDAVVLGDSQEALTLQNEFSEKVF